MLIDDNQSSDETRSAASDDRPELRQTDWDFPGSAVFNVPYYWPVKVPTGLTIVDSGERLL